MLWLWLLVNCKRSNWNYKRLFAGTLKEKNRSHSKRSINRPRVLGRHFSRYDGTGRRASKSKYARRRLDHPDLEHWLQVCIHPLPYTRYFNPSCWWYTDEDTVHAGEQECGDNDMYTEEQEGIPSLSNCTYNPISSKRWLNHPRKCTPVFHPDV